MPLIKSTLARDLASLFAHKPASAADAAAAWAKAYVAYAAAALSSTGSLPLSAPAMQSVLNSAFASAFSTRSAQGAAAVIAQGVVSFWGALLWVGPIASGTTASPGNAGLSGALAGVFGDTAPLSAADKASQLADAFDAGARLVIVRDVPFAPPALPVVGPIS